MSQNAKLMAMAVLAILREAVKCFFDLPVYVLNVYYIELFYIGFGVFSRLKHSRKILEIKRSKILGVYCKNNMSQDKNVHFFIEGMKIYDCACS